MKTTIKKLAASALSLSMLIGLAACGNDAASAGVIGGADGPTSVVVADSSAPSYKVAIVKQLDHASLDEIANAITAELDVIAAEKEINITYEVFSGINDVATLTQIGSMVISDGYDVIIPIATLAAQLMVSAAEDTETPVIFAAVSDPAEAGLTDIPYVTGVSDALNTPFILDMMFAQNPDIQTVGLLYSTSEVNSATPIAEAKAYLDAKGIPYVEKTGNSNDEIISAVASMRDQVDAVFTPTDNVVMATELSISETFIEEGIPHYTGADSFVRNGAFATCGVNYTDLGTYTARMALDAAETGAFPAYHVMDGGIITVNTETAAGLGADYSVFSTLAGEVVEVTTSMD